MLGAGPPAYIFGLTFLCVMYAEVFGFEDPMKMLLGLLPTADYLILSFRIIEELFRLLTFPVDYLPVEFRLFPFWPPSNLFIEISIAFLSFPAWF